MPLPRKLQVDVDPTQVDADYFTIQSSDNEAVDNTMLAFIVSVVASGAETGQVDETDGFQLLEVCSVSAQTLVSAGRYNLAVLRGRLDTAATAFTTANTEVWLVPRALLTFFNNGSFDVIRANRMLATTPDHAQLRFCPFTFVSQLALSAATTYPFRFPLKSAGVPTLTLTSPTVFSYTNPTLPLRLTVAGTWTDTDANLVGMKIILRLASESADRIIVNQSFAPTDSYNFSQIVQLDQAGSWTIRVSAHDATGIVRSTDLVCNVTALGKVCALPDLFDCLGNPIKNGTSGDYAYPIGYGSLGLTYGQYGALDATHTKNFHYAKPAQFIPFGPLQIKCSTPAATLRFWTTGVTQDPDGLSVPAASPWTSYSLEPINLPFHDLINPPSATSYLLVVQAQAAGYTDSGLVAFRMPLFI